MPTRDALRSELLLQIIENEADWLAALHDFRNWLIPQSVDPRARTLCGTRPVERGEGDFIHDRA
jgi:hypothetical protein